MVYIKPQVAINAKMPINLYESLSNLKSAGGGYSIAAIRAPLLVRKPVLITLARIGWSPWYLRISFINYPYCNCSYWQLYIIESKSIYINVSYLVCIIVVPLYNVWYVYSLALYNVQHNGKDVFVTGTDSPKIDKASKFELKHTHDLKTYRRARACVGGGGNLNLTDRGK